MPGCPAPLPIFPSLNHEPALRELIAFLHDEMLPHAEAEHAGTGMDAALAASALVALFLARAEIENTVLLPSLTASRTDLLAARELVGGVPVSGAAGDPSTEPAGTLDLRGQDYATSRRQLNAAMRALGPGEQLVILSGPELRSLRYEMEATVPGAYRWSLPCRTQNHSSTTVHRL